jgi:hypothetical protein
MGLFEKAKNKINARYYGNLDEFQEMEDIQKQWWAYLIYTHKYSTLVNNTIAYRYENNWEDAYKFIDPINNVLKRVANIKAQTYNRPPVRLSNNPQLARIIKNNVHRINKALQSACRLCNACGNVLIVPVLATDRGAPSVLDLIVVPPHDVWLEASYIDYKYNVVARIADKVYIVSEIADDTVEARRNTYIVNQSKDKSIYYADLGDPIWISLENTTIVNPRCVGPIADLVSGTVHIGELETFCNITAWLKSFRQIQSTDDESVNPSDLIPGPMKILPPNIQAIDLINKDDQFEKLIESKAVALAGQHGVSRVAILGDYQSENNWFSVSQELMQHWVAQLETWKQVEYQIWASIAQMSLIDAQDAQVIVHFQNPYLSLQDPAKDFELHRSQAKTGYANILYKILEDNPHLTSLEEAEEFYLNNLNWYSEDIKRKRALNIPDEGIGQSPQDNGAMGVLGKMGPSLVNKNDLEA